MTEPGINWVRLAGADDCLSAAELAHKVEVRVGRTLFVATTEAELFVDGVVGGTARAANGRVFDIKLQVSRPGGEVLGERVLQIEGESCAVIDDAVSLVIAVTLYPRSSLVVAGIPLDPTTAASLQTLFGEEPTELDPSSLPATVAVRPAKPPEPRRTTQPVPKSEGSAPSSVQLSIDAIGAGEVGQLPDVRFAVGGYFRVFPRSLIPVEAGAAYYFTTTDGVPEGGSVRFELMTASLTGCPWTFLSEELRGCLGIEGGLLTATPRNLAITAQRTTDPVLNILFAAVYRPQIAGPLHLRAGLVVGVPVLQHEFLYQARDGTSATLFQTSQIQGRADLGLGLSF